MKKDIEAVTGRDVGGAYFKRLGALDVVEFRVRDEEKLDPVIRTTRYVCLPDTVDPRGPKGR